jgi:glycosyltransferase involved in cell wall biosynthesis
MICSMQVEIVICTWNRAELLDQTLESMKGLILPADVQWRVSVVNNHCTDATDDVLQRHKDRLPLRRLWEPKLGKSHALNRAIDATESDLILWTDDDVMVDSNWLASYVAAAQRLPEVSFFGGTVTPWFESDAPDWLARGWHELQAVYAVRQLGEEEFNFSPGILPYGANMAVRTEAQRRYRYNERLGRVGPSDVRGEEFAMMEEMLADGLRGTFIPDAKVQHYIPDHRMTLDYVHRFYFGAGIATSLCEMEAGTPPHKRRFHEIYLRFKAAMYGLQYRLSRRFSGPSSWVHKLTRSSYYQGRLSHLEDLRNAGDVRKAA